MRRSPAVAVAAAGLVAAVLVAGGVVVLRSLGSTSAPPTTDAAPARTRPLPRSMAAVGDSITVAFASCPAVLSCAEESWSTGTAPGLDSHAQRLTAAGSLPAGAAVNGAVAGARAADLAGQVRLVAPARPGYVTVLVGANDACAASPDDMTPVAQFRAGVAAALDELVAAVPDVSVLVVSIPDLYRLWEVGRRSGQARETWERFGICASMLADAASESADDERRRQQVRARVADYNAALAAECARHDGCRTDEGAVFANRFALEDVSQLDFFHPSAAGQASLARITWEAARRGFGW